MYLSFILFTYKHNFNLFQLQKYSPNVDQQQHSYNNQPQNYSMECNRFSEPPPDVITSPPKQSSNNNQQQTQHSWKGQSTSGVKPMLLLTSIPSVNPSKEQQSVKDLNTTNSYNAHSLSSFAVPYPAYTPLTRHGQYQPVYHQTTHSEPGVHHVHTTT